MEPGVWPVSRITRSEHEPTGMVSPSSTVRVTGTPVCSVIASASGAPATTSAPVAATTSASARWWSQCWWVVMTWVSPASPIRGSNVDGSAAASMSTWSPVEAQRSR